jgi:hypothetical protein
MKKYLALLVLVGVWVAGAASADEHDVRFAAVDIYLDSAEPVAAWQFELSNRTDGMKIVGVEQGDSPAYARAPYYDREAVRLGEADRIIVADYSLADVVELPSGRVRVATVHLMLNSDDDADFDLFLVTATTYDGVVTDARISLDVRTGSEQ